jgi:cell division protein FtsB
VSGASAVFRLLPFGLLVFAVVCVPLRILSEDGLPRYRKLGDQLARVQAQNEQMRKLIAKRSREVRALRTSPDAVEQIARDELGMVRDDEVIFQFAPSQATFLTNGSELR